MATYLLDFHENIRFSKTLSEYREQPQLLFIFLDPPKKMHFTFVEYSWNIQEIFLYSIFPEHYFGNIPWNFIGKFFRIYREYIMGMFHEYSANIYLLGGVMPVYGSKIEDIPQKSVVKTLLNILLTVKTE